ncbi:MAG: sigma-70 family RNA polymerase sigma factor [Ignavibacteriaceae bacterium]|nr:sigma-70 family RNA polymerase sigma factor [Ignavibacteriaceae bacterium]
MSEQLTSLTDAEIMKRIANYDSRALETLYNRYSPILYTLIKKIVGDVQVSEEVLIDVFVIIWRKINYYDIKNGDAYSYLIAVARNKAIDTIRRSKNLIPDAYDDDYENFYIVPRLSPQIDDLDLKTAIGIKDNIEKALNKLTDAQKYVLFLGYYEGLSQSEIAQHLRIPPQTVKSKVKIALSNLKDNLLKGGE